MISTVLTILGGAALTYATRFGGHMVLSRFERVPPRVEAALDAVPAAVLTTLVAPELLSAGPAEWIAVIASAAVAWRRGMLEMFLTGAITLIVLRQFVG